jgi:hypothetical protein
MRLGTAQSRLRECALRGAVALVCVSLLLPGPRALAQQAGTPPAQAPVAASPEKLEHQPMHGDVEVGACVCKFDDMKRPVLDDRDGCH